MLARSPLPSLEVRIQLSCEYIQNTLDQEGSQLSFTNQATFRQHYGIMNTRVAKFLLNLSIKTYLIFDLNLNSCQLRDQTFQIISKANWCNLQKLGIYNNNFTSKIYIYLKNGKWKKLREIDLSDNQFDSQNGNKLGQCLWQNLERIQLANNSLSWSFYKDLQINKWNKTTFVNLKSTNIGFGSLSVLTKMNWPNLQHLNLERNFITNQGMRSLSKGQWINLRILNLSNNYVKFDGVRILSRANWKKLQIINLQYENTQQRQRRYPFFSQKIINIVKSIELAKFNAKQLTAHFMYIPIRQDWDHPIIQMLRQKNIESQV